MRPTSADISTTGLERSSLPRFRRAVALGTAGASGIALAGLLAFALGIRALGSIRPDFIPMAPSTAACFLILSVALYGHDGKRWSGIGRTSMAALVLLVAVFCLLEFIGSLAGLDLTGEDRLTSSMGTLGAIPVGRMSVATAALFVIAALGTGLLALRSWGAGRAARLGHVASSLGVLTALLGGTVLLGYLFGTPLMSTGGAVPVAATTAIAFLCLGMALAATAGPASFPVRMVVGDAFEAWLSRVFLALTASSLLTLGILTHVLSDWAPRNEALLTSALIAVACVITAFVVARVVRRFGVRLAESEQLLQETEARHTAMVANIADVIVIIDKDGVNRYKSPNVERMFGWTSAELIGASAFDTVHPDDVRALRTVFGALVSAPSTSATTEFRYRCKDGEYKWVEITVVNLLHDPTIAGFLGNYRDITERKRAEEARMHQAAELAESQRIARIGSWEWMIATNVIRWSDAMNHLLARAPGSPPPTFAELAPFYPPESWRRLGVAIASAVESGTSYDLEVEMIRGDGTTCWTTTRGEAVRGADGAVVKLRGTVQDITELKQAEQAKLTLSAQLQQAQKMESVGRLAGGVAHDFNNMLGVILGNVDLALGQVDGADPLRADLEEIKGAALHSVELTRQLLAFARKQAVSPKVLDLNETVAGMLKMLKRLIGEDIDLRWNPTDGLWLVKIDPSQVDQMLANLCVNARDAIEGTGKLTIETGHRTFTAADCVDRPEFLPGEYAMLAVSDDGSGMDAETLSHLFEPFFTTKTLGKGTGLGLATVYGIVRQNGGFIDVYSELSHGTSFRIYLPRHVGKAEQVRVQEQRPLAARGHETILVAEDEPGILALAAKLLERQGYTVLCASTPGEALRLAREHAGEIQLLMTDVVMPEMNGRDLAKSLLSLYPHMKRLFMSGYTADVIAHRGVLDDDVQFIQKPFSLEDLTAKVRAVLDQE